MKNGYERFVRPLLFSLDAESAHHVTVQIASAARRTSILRYARSDSFSRPSKPITLFGLELPKPHWTRGRTG